MRAGELGREWVELAAALRHPAALAICPDPALLRLVRAEPGPLRVELDPAVWEALGSVAHARLGWALAMLGVADGDVPDHQARLRVCEDWLLDPTPEAMAAVARHDNADLWGDRKPTSPSEWAIGPIRIPSDLMGDLLRIYLNRALELRLKAAKKADREADPQVRDALAAAAFLSELGARVTPWALGYGDPVWRRVAKRREAEILPEDLQA